MATIRRGLNVYTSEVTWSGGSWAAGYPVTNAGTVEFGRPARSADLTSSSLVIIGTLAAIRPAQLVGVVFDNATLAATCRLRTYDSADGLLYDSGAVRVFPDAIFEFGSIPYGAPNWFNLGYTDADITGFRRVLPFDTGAVQLVKSFRLDFTDAGNPDTYLDIAHVGVSDKWTLEINPQYGAEFGLVDRAGQVQARGGAKVFDDLPNPREFVGVIEHASRAEAWERAYEDYRRNRTSMPFLWWPEVSGAASDQIREVFFARNAALGRLRWQYFRAFGFPVAVEEVL